MHYINFNGKIFEENKPIIGAQSRGLRYGDGLFETLKLKQDKIIFADEHFARLWKGMQLLQFTVPKLFTPEKLTAEIYALAKKNRLPNARVRLNIFRADGGLFDAANHIPQYTIETTELSPDTGLWNNNGLQLCIYDEIRKSTGSFSNLKTNNFLPYVMAALAAKKNRCNDAIVLNSDGNVCDTAIANIFCFKNNVLFTSALATGCVAGILRRFILDKCREENITVEETILTIEMLLQADEVFLTNSIYNLRWVSLIDAKTFKNEKTRELYNLLLKKHPSDFC